MIHDLRVSTNFSQAATSKLSDLWPPKQHLGRDSLAWILCIFPRRCTNYRPVSAQENDCYAWTSRCPSILYTPKNPYSSWHTPNVCHHLRVCACNSHLYSIPSRGLLSKLAEVSQTRSSYLSCFEKKNQGRKAARNRIINIRKMPSYFVDYIRFFLRNTSITTTSFACIQL